MPRLLTLLCVLTVFLSVGIFPAYSTHPNSTTAPLVRLHLRPVPDHPVTEGQSVVLHCEAPGSAPDPITWIWERKTSTADNATWTEEGRGVRELSLRRPEQSGEYRCRAQSPQGEFVESNVHSVLIVSKHRTALDDLGVAGFVLSVLAVILILAVVFGLIWKKSNSEPATLNTSTGHANAPKVIDAAPPVDSDQDVYMNYTCTKDDYTDLDPSNMTDENIYSSLS